MPPVDRSPDTSSDAYFLAEVLSRLARLSETELWACARRLSPAAAQFIAVYVRLLRPEIGHFDP
jgi:hypothetical protein